MEGYTCENKANCKDVTEKQKDKSKQDEGSNEGRGYGRIYLYALKTTYMTYMKCATFI